MKRTLILITVFASVVSMVMAVPLSAAGDTRTVTYLENSDHEITIYFINGKEPGATMMIMGGIQGDEPGGYLAADLYADMRLEKGSLIVVPRTNFFSIRRNQRGVDGDLNRKFGGARSAKDIDSNIIGILQSLMEKSDVLLNLHEGSGFYSPDSMSTLRNPSRYGQSIIADASTYKRPDGKVIDLETTVRRVLKDINGNIRDTDHHFLFNNHNTLSETTHHREQRKSATFHALTVVGIPAFGIETSKEISSIETKVRYQTLAINAFMKEFDIVPEHPSISLPTPELDHLVINVVGNPVPFAVKNGSALTVPPGTPIHITSIVANYERGLSLDIIGAGNSNDLGRIITINSSTVIKVYKDAYLCGEVNVVASAAQTTSRKLSARMQKQVAAPRFEIRIGDKNMVVSGGDTLHIIRGDMLEIVNAEAPGADPNLRVNFVGFVGNERRNDAEDRGYRIDTAKDLITRFSTDGNGMEYRIEALSGQRVVGTMFVMIGEPKVDYIIVERSDGSHLAFSPGEDIRLAKPDTLKFLSVVSNVRDLPPVTVSIHDGNGGLRECTPSEMIEVAETVRLSFRRMESEIGFLTFRIDR